MGRLEERVVPSLADLPRDPAWLSVPGGALAAVVALFAVPLDGGGATMLAITLFCIALWLGTPVPPEYTGLLCIGLVGVVFSPDLALTGFHSPAVWLVVFGLMVGEAAKRTGLASHGGRLLLERAGLDAAGDGVPVASTYRRLVALLALVGIGLTVLVPSVLVRITLLAPIAIEIGSFFEDDRARMGLFLVPLLATFYAAPGVFTASLPNVVAMGIAESLGAATVSWSAWALQLFPVMGIGSGLIAAAVVYVRFRPAGDATVSAPSPRKTAGGDERRMVAFLLVGVLVWMTDFVHGLHPVFGALLVVLLALAPRIGVVSLDDLASVDLSIVFFLGAVFAIGAGFTETGVTELAAAELLSLVPADAPLPVVLALVFAVSMLLTFLIEGIAVASVLTPILVTYAGTAAVPLEPVIMIEAVALNTYFFPYQAAPLVVILGEGVVDTVSLIRTVALASLLTLAVLLPIQIGLFTLLY